MEYRFSDRLKDLSGNAIREIFKLLQNPKMISFAGGLPASEALPLNDVKEIANRVLSSEKGISILQYGSTEGYAPLMESGAEHLKRVGIVGVEKENLLIVSGGQQGIDLAMKAFVNKGDTVLVEDPTYLAVLHIGKTYEANLVGVDSGADGIDLTDLEAKIQKYNPKIVYLVPNFQNPTGRTLGLEKRKAIAELTAKYSVLLIEDDPYGEIRYEGERIPAIKSFDKAGNVLYISSFSKIISPGLRVALAVADQEVIRKLTVGKQAVDVHTNTLAQAIVDGYLRSGKLDADLARVTPMYKIKKDNMIRAIEMYFPEETTYTNPEGGLFLWLEFPERLDVTKVFPKAVENYVAYVSGVDFYADEGRGKNTMRLNFSNATPEQIERGMERLGNLLKEELKRL